MLTALRLHRFRCYDTLRWEIPAEGALLLGDNAQGKTSLLEALCLALSLHSPRASRLERLAQHGSPHFGIALDSDEGNRRLLW
ncbi:MAG: AAA family ATPase, partial [Akkermansia sp.]